MTSTSEDVVTSDRVRAAVELVEDPELRGVTIADLGMVQSVKTSTSATVRVELLATFLGCPARSVIEADVIASVRAATGLVATVVWAVGTWSTDAITPCGHRALAELGIVVPGSGCPRCGAPLDALSASAATACRSVARCTDCREIVEVMRGPSQRSVLVSIGGRRDGDL
jgi:ring-1,2-phenylacetyl-CoA epoxidase subunit PaaD